MPKGDISSEKNGKSRRDETGMKESNKKGRQRRKSSGGAE